MYNINEVTSEGHFKSMPAVKSCVKVLFPTGSNCEIMKSVFNFISS